MDTKRSILTLGAGIYQVPLIRKAQRRGLRAVVASIPGNYPGFAEADKVYYIDTTDKEAILRIAREERVCAVTTTGTDVAVSSIGYVCDRLGLPGIGEDAARLLTDKALMKQAFSRGGVTTAPFRIVRTLDEARAAAEALGLWRFPDERPIQLEDAVRLCSGHGEVIAKRLNRAILLTQGIVLVQVPR